jgi:CDP-diacylglycerol---glycerol-3-phosphate 3-phosphatidyltransferase
MLTISNSLSLMRAPLAFLFLSESTTLRALALFLAAFTDSIDGYLARRSKSTSKFGAVLDPVMDKFFVYFVLSVLLLESKIFLWQIAFMLCRDIFFFIFGIYLWITSKWNSYEIHAVKWGKITTALQFIVLLGITMGLYIPWFIYPFFILFGFLAFMELVKYEPKKTV